MATQTINSGFIRTDELTFSDSTTTIPTRYVDRALVKQTNSAGGFSFVAKMRKEKAVDTRTPKTAEDLLIKNFAVVASAYNAGATSITVETGQGQRFGSRDYVVNKTKGGGRHLVVSVSTDTVTVRANIDGGTSIAGEAGDELLIMAPLTEEGGPVPRGKMTEKTQYTWYIPHHVTALEFTDEGRRSGSWFTPDMYPYEKVKRFTIEHVRDRDSLALWGGKGAAYTQVATLTDFDPDAVANTLHVPWGFFPWMDVYAETERKFLDATLTKQEFIKKFKFAFYGDDEPKNKEQVMFFYEQDLAEGIMLWYDDNVRIEARVGTKTRSDGSPISLGFTWSEWNSPFGVIKMKMLEALHSRVSGGLNHYIFADTSKISWQPFRKGSHEHDTEIVLDMVQDRYFRTVDLIHEYACPIFRQPNSHAYGRFAEAA